MPCKAPDLILACQSGEDVSALDAWQLFCPDRGASGGGTLIRFGDLEVPTLDDVNVDGKRVLVRIDINSPVNDAGMLLDDSRIRSHVLTVAELLKRGNAVVLMSHQGRPGGKDFVSLEQHARVLSRHLGIDVMFIDDVVGPHAREVISRLRPGSVAMLENVRLVSEELVEATPQQQARTLMVRRLAPLFDLYINDAFATAHRSQPSVVGFPMVLPSAAGRLFERELRALSRVFDRSEAPKVFVFGGAKALDTLRAIEFLVRSRLADRILTGGLVGEMFAIAKGIMLSPRNMEVLEKLGLLSLVPRARKILMNGAPIEVPIDYRTLDGNEIKEEPAGRASGLIMDIGSATLQIYSSLIEEARVVVIRGPMGVIEDPRFRDGSMGILRAAVDGKGYVIVGGGHMATLSGQDPGTSTSKLHVSSGAGAFLLALSGESLPAVQALAESWSRFGTAGGAKVNISPGRG